METINLIPYPEKVKFSGDTVDAAVLDNCVRQTVEKGTYGDEGYAIHIDGQGVTVLAESERGFFYAEQTLKQLRENKELPCMTVTDRPAYAYRGFLIDSARHMQSVDELKKLIDAAALFKFNKFHWHLSDDQGFRIESERFPLLNSVGSYRASSDFGGEHLNVRYGGYYTKDEIRDVVAYCAARQIEVIPELDVPGHTTAMIASYPALSCRRLAIPLETKQGIFNNLLCAGNENTFSFLFKLLDEICELFPSQYIHLGGDEAPKTYWEKCPKCRARKAELGFENYEQLQGWFTNRLIAHLAEKGRKAIVWNESLNGDNLDESATVQMWMDRRGKSAVWANRAGSVIACPFTSYYCDYPYSMTPVSKTYAFDPVFKGVAPIMRKFVVGVTVPLWTEYISSFDRACYMAFPRFAAVAERGWSKQENPDYDSFRRRFIALTPLLERMEIRPAPPADWDPNKLDRLTETVRFFKDKIDPQAVKNSIGSTNQ